MDCLVVPDERSAGYFALGIAQRTRETVAVVCTSGTAVLNLAPAVCEAFYQKIPLLILTADRPPEMIDKGENQAIHQQNIFSPHTLANYQLPAEPMQQHEWMRAGDDICNGIEQTQEQGGGPVHINIPMREPLYVCDNHAAPDFEPMILPAKAKRLSDKEINELQRQWVNTSRKMVLVGLHDKEITLENKLCSLAKREDTVVLTEATSNMHSPDFIAGYETALALLLANSSPNYVPEIVVTIGKQIISKKIRQWLKKNPPLLHWHIATTEENWDIFDKKVYTGAMDTLDFLTAILPTETAIGSSFKSDWQNLYQTVANKQAKLIEEMPYSDFSLMKKLIDHLPQHATVHYGNSTPIRYANLFSHRSDLTVYANRGTSGIDGCLSTAAGSAYTQTAPTVVILGDVSFFYDSNGLWHNYLMPNFKIVVINNSGGNIFRLIDGPTSVDKFETFFETKHQLSAKHLAALHQLNYFSASNETSLKDALELFLQSNDKPALLEVFTNGETSAAVYKKYWQELVD